MKKFSSKTRESSRPPSKTKWWIIGLLGLLALGVMLPGFFSTAGGAIMYPFHMARVWWFESEASLPRYVQEKQSLIAEINNLERELAQTKASDYSETLLRDENERLRSLLYRDEEQRVVARVLARPNQLPYDVLQLDRGSVHDIPLWAPVYLGQDQVIGFVSHVGQYYSYVTLASTPGQRSTAYVLGPDIYTSAEGVGDGQLRVRVPQGIAVAEGDVVILPSVSAGVYGAVSYVETSPTEPQKYAYVPLPTSLHSVRYVSVAATPIESPSFAAAAAGVEATREDLLQLDVPPEAQVGTSTASTTVATTTATNTPVQP